MAEEAQEKPKSISELFPDFEQKYRKINELYVTLWESGRKGSKDPGAENEARQLLSWAEGVITTYHSMEEMEELTSQDTKAFSKGMMLSGDELLVKQLYISYQALKGVLK